MMGPSAAGWPAAIVVSCQGPDPGCYGSLHHPCYLTYANNSALTGATYFDIVDTADGDDGHKVINCSIQWDDNTVVACRAQWGGDQDITCAEVVPVEPTTWGRIKTLYR
jgi:hypothetical protein